MNAFTRAAAALVADANLGSAITYRPASAPRISCRGVFSRPLGEFGQVVAGGLMVSVSAAEVPAPFHGDAVILTEPLALGGSLLRAGLVLTVEKAEADATGAMFDLTLSLPA